MNETGQAPPCSACGDTGSVPVPTGVEYYGATEMGAEPCECPAGERAWSEWVSAGERDMHALDAGLEEFPHDE